MINSNLIRTVFQKFRSIFFFGLVGITASTVHVITGLTLVKSGLLEPFFANIVAFIISFMVSYFGHHRFSFQSDAEHSQAFPRFVVVAALGLTLNQVNVWLFVDVWGLDYAYALIVVVTVIPAITYVLSRLWAFENRPRSRVEPKLD